MGIIAWVVLGLVAGLIARALVKDDPAGGIIATIVVGIVGALGAGFIAQALGVGDPIDEFWDFSTWLAAIVGAVVLLMVWGAVSGRRGGHARL